MSRSEFLPILIVLFCAIYFAWDLRWVCDDAFISFRYAKNFSEGGGLVYNPHEFVEGYTNFSWTLLMSIPLFLGLDVLLFSHISSIAFYLFGCIGMLWSLKERRVCWFSFLCWVSVYHVSVFATSGLETSMFLCLIIWAFRILEIKHHSFFLIIGVLLSLTRPEGALFSLLGAVFISRKCTLQLISLLSLYAVWKLFYYGDLLPNTFYAKGSENRWQQGLLYVGLFLQTYWPMVPIFCLAIWEVWKKRNIQLYWYVGICSTILFLHVIRVGGDFMFARFLLPLIPFLFLMGQNGVESLFFSDRNKQILMALMSSLFLLQCRHASSLETYQDGVVGIEGITEERYWYPHSIIEQAQGQGRDLKDILEETDARIVILGMQAMLAYYGEFPYVLEGMNGLTDYELARRKNALNRVGHGQRLSASYLQERDIDMFIDFRLQRPTHPFFYIQLTPDLGGQLFVFRTSLLQQLKERGSHFTDIEDVFEETLKQDVPAQYLKDQGVPISYLQKYYLGRGNKNESKYRHLLLSE